MAPAAQDMSARSSSMRPDTLALLFQGIFTAIVRIQSGKQPLADIEGFRRRMKSALQEAERDAITAHYSNDDVTNAEFAVVALLDEAILSSKDPGRDEWRKKTLNVELFGEANAGEVFFDRLQTLVRREESQRMADLLEVYLLCLLLGFEGRFGGRDAGRSAGARGACAPQGLRPPAAWTIRFRRPSKWTTSRAPSLPLSAKGPDTQWLKWVAGTVVALLVLFVLYKVHLSWRVDELQELVNR